MKYIRIIQPCMDAPSRWKHIWCLSAENIYAISSYSGRMLNIKFASGNQAMINGDDNQYNIYELIWTMKIVIARNSNARTRYNSAEWAHFR